MTADSFQQNAACVGKQTYFGELAQWYHKTVFGDGLLSEMTVTDQGFEFDIAWSNFPGETKDRIDALIELKTGETREGKDDATLSVPYSAMPREYQEAIIMDCVLRLDGYLNTSEKQSIIIDGEQITQEKVINMPNDENVVRIAQRLLNFLPRHEGEEPGEIQINRSDVIEGLERAQISGTDVAKITALKNKITPNHSMKNGRLVGVLEEDLSQKRVGQALQDKGEQIRSALGRQADNFMRNVQDPKNASRKFNA